MQFTAAIASAILLFSAGALAAPVPQLAGEGAAANSVLSSTDNGIGFGIENAEDNTAGLITKVKSGTAVRRQLAGEGAAANSVLSSTDNGIGFGIENAEDNTANLIASTKGGITPSKFRRQLDKIANGAKSIGNAAGVSAITDPVGNAGDSADGTLTSDAANAGASVGSTEESTLEGAGSAVPKFRRQLDKIANGAKSIGNAAGVSAITDPVGNAGDSADGTLTSDAANAGASVGSTEEKTLEAVGSAVPK